MSTTQLNLPEKFLEKIQSFIPKETLPFVLESFSTKPLPTLRVNTLKIAPSKLTEQLEAQKFILTPISWYKDAFALANKSSRELTETEEYKQGLFYIQGLSSMIPALVLEPKLNEKILDLCAAPGSKTTQMATLMQNTGTIIANDSSRARFYRLLNNLKEQGVINTTVLTGDGKTIWQKYPEYFDKVLLDAPCSMEGRFTTLDPKSYKEWTPGKVRKLAQLQGYLLRSAISSTKVGGTIVYSTCTLSPEENEGVIDWILKKEGESIEIEQIVIPHLSLGSGITFWHKEYNPLVKLTARIYPSKTMEGFFITKIKKIKSTVPII